MKNFFLLFSFLITNILVSQTIFFVDQNATGLENGSSWTNAYVDLQDAIASAGSGDEIWVAAGNYHAGSLGTDSYVLIDGVAIYGGFTGSETLLSQRDWEVNLTRLNGDFNDDDIFGTGTWYSGWNIVTDNTDVIVLAENVGSSTVIDGFQIESAYIGQNDFGSAMKIVNASPVVNNCTFYRNFTSWGTGAAIQCSNSSFPTITNCLFYQNLGQFSKGIGIGILDASQPIIEDCVFLDNTCLGSDVSPSRGVAIYNHFAALPLTVRRSSFIDNTAARYSVNGNQADYGGAIYNMVDGMELHDCVFEGNSANYGGAVATTRSATIVNCLFNSNVAWGLQSSGGWDVGDIGSAILCNSSTPGSTLINCTVVNNIAGEGAIASFQSGSVNIFNCIIYNNIATGEEVIPIKAQISGDSNIEHSCVQALLAPIPGEDPPDPENFPGCFDVLPQFVDPLNIFHLSATSPCIDAANNEFYPASGSLSDLDGATRFQDDLSTPDIGVGMAPIIDMGAYELQDSYPLCHSLGGVLGKPLGLTKSFNPVPFIDGVLDRVQVKWYKALPKVRYQAEDQVACEINIWPVKDLITAEPIDGDTIIYPKETVVKPGKELFKWGIKYRADGANNVRRVEPNTRYRWKVRCYCEEGAGEVGPWSDTKIFNTPDFDPVTGIYTLSPGIVDGSLKANKNVSNSNFNIPLHVYPNPGNDIIMIDLGAYYQEADRVQLIDLSGRIIEQIVGPTVGDKSIITFDISKLAPGLYAVCVYSEKSFNSALIEKR